MVFGVGWSEATIIILLALLLFGPEKMTEFARTLGRLYAEYKNAKRRFELEVLYGKEVIDRDLKEIRELKKLTEIDGMKILDYSQEFTPNIQPKYEQNEQSRQEKQEGQEEQKSEQEKQEKQEKQKLENQDE